MMLTNSHTRATCIRDSIASWFIDCFAPDKGAKYCDKCVYMSVCPFVYPFECLKTTCPNFTKFTVHVICVRGSVLFSEQCNMLCVFNFADDIIFSHNAANGAESNTALFRQVRQLTTPGTKSDVYTTALVMAAEGKASIFYRWNWKWCRLTNAPKKFRGPFPQIWGAK